MNLEAITFRHERNINVLDRYADQVLGDVCGMRSSFAKEDYMNYLQYLKVVVPHELDGHRDMFEELKKQSPTKTLIVNKLKSI